jgi:glycosyltransferase involved in cell wall biosynthesis
LRTARDEKSASLDLTIIIPAYNESHTIAKTIGDFQVTFPDARIVVIDNNSTDNTGSIAKGALRDQRDLLLIERRQGKGIAVKKGLSRVSSDVYIMVDGDGTYRATDAALLLEILMDGRCDMVVGDRVSRGAYASQNIRPGHDLGNRLLTRFISFLAGQKYVDVLSGLRVMSRPFVNVLDVRSAGFQLETELNVIAAYARAEVIEIPIDYLQRPEGSKSKLNTVGDGIKIIWFALINWLSFYPLQPLGILAAIAFAISGILGVRVFIIYFEFGEMPYSSTAIAAAAAGLVGLQSIFAGLVLRILMRERRRGEVARLLDMRRLWNAKLDE